MSQPAMTDGIHHPSAAQLSAYQARPAQRPVVLFYQYRLPPDRDSAAVRQALAALARSHGGELRWAGEQEQVLIGPLGLYPQCCRLHFRSRAAALRHLLDPRHAEALFSAQDLQVAAIGEQARALKIAVAWMARLLPLLPFDRRLDEGPEPGLGSSIMPSAPALEAFLRHPRQQAPVVMVNWLRFRPLAQYSEPGATPGSGKAAYYRYGKVAFDTLHRLGARALFIGRYQQALIGNGGEVGNDRWDEFAMVEYPGRASFKLMTSLRRYRAALHHRTAGLAEDGQGLVVTRTL